MERRIKLDKGEYYELKARLLEVELQQARLIQTKQGLQSVFVPLAKTYGFDVSLNYSLDDATCELVAPDVPEKA